MLQSPAPTDIAADGAFRPLTTTAPREYVHRAALAEVFLTADWCRTDETRFTFHAQWPRGHSFFVPVDGSHYDPMLTAETIRQVGAILAHVGFDVPLGHQFLMWELNYRVEPRLTRIGGAPAELRLDVTCSDVRRRSGRLTGLRYEVVARQGGRVLATGSARYTVTSPEVYRRLRGDRLTDPQPWTGRPAAPTEPAAVGRDRVADVVLSPTGHANRWQLRVDTRHPVLFDHPGDHIPGMVLLEAARQAVHGQAPTGRTALPVAMDSAFHHYAEFGSPCWIEAEPAVDDPGGPKRLIRVTGRQDGQVVFTAITTVAELPA
ncbi:hypothetical protein EAO71_02830 [Streptomyces sp. ms191]|uniref:ScbA/BarX family gamma-butyrolactone biosynthesis protein n=1 Tax=unclassified Streptomyces TaxID=2593676 RepID=UPI0011CE3991|nr:ScbA/BarX family gamma-butyrolactone biosynthesis protein [Streptomyces sp. ms191]TXS33644.1 hypothetical protein EAO71_02830 [Streptomyces sp. ms191]